MNSNLLVWCDLETTGLNAHDVVLEIAVVLTDSDLNELGDFQSLVLSTSPGLLVRESEYQKEPRAWPGIRPPSHRPCYDAHFESGLIEELKSATHLSDAATVERRLLNWLFEFGMHSGVGKLPSGDRPALCGSSVWFDRNYLARDFPSFLGRLSHTQIDVSTTRRLQKMWAPDLEVPEKKEAHRALPDIRESIELLRFYRKVGFIG